MPTLSGKRVTNAAATNFLAASNLLRLARSVEEGSFYWSMASIVFSAFAYEAFLNMIGQKVLTTAEWKKIDRASCKEKHQLLLKKLELTSDLSSEPESTLVELFEFRNRIAHGREEEIQIDGISIADVRPLTLQEVTSTEWEKRCTPEYAAAALEHVRALGVMVCTAAHEPIYGSNPFGTPSRGSYGTVVDAQPIDQPDAAR
ncbi:MAG: hypothetical protein K9K30_14105 [Burkholderiaceae bacterium]|nr:hypothetical protein [Sulfuritalea sp.]MCF8176368.1 hypothetical protein [Burkholderiaceae bacterium]MCF8185030.1 hypothetical protein [Polynucleobacter sp.]